MIGYTTKAKINIVKNQVDNIEKFIATKMAMCEIEGGSLGLYEPPGLGQPLISPGHCNNSSIDQMIGGFYNHISSTWGQMNVYESKVQAISTSPNCNPSEGYIHIIWGTNANGKKYFHICSNVGESEGANKLYEKKIFHWQ